MTASRSSTGLRVIRPSETARAKLIFFPHAGGTAASFRNLCARIPMSFECLAVEYPGHGARLFEQACQRIEELAADAGPSIQKIATMPLVFYGHSMGALVALEAIQLLKEQGVAPKLFVASAHRAPGLPSRHPSLDGSTDAEVVQLLASLNGVPDSLLQDQELMSLTVPIIRTDFAACDQYEVRDRSEITVPLVAYGGVADPHVTKAELEGWSTISTSFIGARLFPGDHFFIDQASDLVAASIERDSHGLPASTTFA